MSIIVYTSILGASDSLKQAPTGADRCVCFADTMYGMDSLLGWELVGVVSEQSRRDAWHLRCIADQLFPEAQTSVWVDASFTVTDLPRLLRQSDGHDLAALAHHKRTSCYEEGDELIKIGQSSADHVHGQLGGYRYQQFAPSSLTIGCVVVRHHTPKVKAFNDRWDAEIKQHPGDNCQLSIDYAAWKEGLAWHHLEGTRHANPYAVHDHADHKRRRKPYR